VYKPQLIKGVWIQGLARQNLLGFACWDIPGKQQTGKAQPLPGRCAKGVSMGNFKYVLTRICLRKGQMTLTGKMLERFPKEGSLIAIDTVSGEGLDLSIGPRLLTGLGDFFRRHRLEVNDEVHIAVDNDHYLFTAHKHSPKGDAFDIAQLTAWVSDFYEQGTPLSEAEIRFLHDLPPNLDIGNMLLQDGRFTVKEGRWQRADRDLPELVPELESLTDQPAPPVAVDELAYELEPVARTTITSYSKASLFPSDTGLNSVSEPVDLSQQHRLKDLFTWLGFRVDSLAHGQLLAHADLNRRHYSAYLHILPAHAQPDWAALLSRRRETGANYAAVFGEHLDLLRLGAPAGMARATLWSWHGVQRLEDIHQVIVVSPYDLESHFERDGLFEHGLERFERSLAKRIAERGSFSAVLARLATMKAPGIFVLDDLLDQDNSREQVLKVLELLAQAPFHLVAKVDNGEFALRYKIADALLQLSDYALSLRERLPNRHKERLSSLIEENLGQVRVVENG
jgi:hypothetical protein